jgi:hypothetical protein
MQVDSTPSAVGMRSKSSRNGVSPIGALLADCGMSSKSEGDIEGCASIGIVRLHSRCAAPFVSKCFDE